MVQEFERRIQELKEDLHKFDEVRLQLKSMIKILNDELASIDNYIEELQLDLEQADEKDAARIKQKIFSLRKLRDSKLTILATYFDTYQKFEQVRVRYHSEINELVQRGVDIDTRTVQSSEPLAALIEKLNTIVSPSNKNILKDLNEDIYKL